ncbi:L-lactate dehydrogenase complex protein LldE [Streptoalloteichus tenebrarius]|uniref:L-lactate dehydrogenase complex protein LldE n=1 Tax=Streptoalloteichus tenebrarius (strain ATCC 17920 / DSM 40477 / JCM 4838 / CBS 697.72 / NBRC 16177 / NCIMB 11028 / NRRL B-12390 / A12253. 1 / ISP 5477) TaxID=1933 RepID=A0ABT1HYF8_STRSD|nr:L-lactate dehydrogenase complex protein LldE [Streptoalloteichus tenebrarius]BFF01883.1 (Fe-S)-binding protein [Streptoalloteichus tenebrarius]
MRVALFATCLTDTLFPGTAIAATRLLERLGCRVEFPLDQTCCGQMHLNTGYREHAADLAERYAAIFAGYDAVVAPSGSCVAMVREFHQDLVASPSRNGAVRHTYELSEFLVDVLGVTDVGAYFPHRVTYHPTCHSLRAIGVGDRPLRLLSSVRGLDLVALPEAETCCGFGGTFAVKNADVSTAMLADKMRCVAETGAEVLTAGDNSCLMHIGGGLSRLRVGVRTVHLAEILASTEEEPWRAPA